ncbi:UrcA family protein [Erythrobacter sp. JK5]|uniref:UrcA family protein n=1 Tax=Erythrobacter sp. JK5 TaxID=2829500 RepID=UPI001BA9E681|nr:UrcA family protein [Erythrobacter sp. JK5]QUL37254.1 UrcA family protein [Erythrobacter sp. JK5]
MKTLTLAAAAFGVAATAVPAIAGQSPQPTTVVSTAGLDLATPEGQKMLDKRVNAAARRICQTDRAPTGSRLRTLESRSCYAKARASAKRQVASAIADQQRGG